MAHIIKDEETLREYERAALAEAQSWARDLQAVMDTREGRRVLWEILEFTKPFASSFTGNSTGFFLDGKKSVGLWLYQQLDAACFDKFLEARREHMNRQLEKEESRG